MIVESSLPLPYDYSINESNVYIFSTVNGARYTVYFLEISFFESCKLYSFNFEKTKGIKVFDKRVSATIVEIIKEFFQKNSDSLIFTCDNMDKRHEFRNKLFERWFNIYSQQEYFKYNRRHNDVLASLIIQTNNPLREAIINEFDSLFDDINL